MGHAISYRCPHCGYIFEANMGIGFLYSNLRNVLDCLAPAMHRKAKAVLDELHTDGPYNAENIEYEHRIFRSPATGLYYSRFYVKIASPTDGTTLFETVYKCPRTGVVLEMLSDMNAIKRNPCPECGKRGMEEAGGICWD